MCSCCTLYQHVYLSLLVVVRSPVEGRHWSTHIATHVPSSCARFGGSTTRSRKPPPPSHSLAHGFRHHKDTVHDTAVVSLESQGLPLMFHGMGYHCPSKAENKMVPFPTGDGRASFSLQVNLEGMSTPKAHTVFFPPADSEVGSLCS